jgi:hypothetical protein
MLVPKPERVHQAWRLGRLPDDVHVIFANTGKEREETLVFVNEIAKRWSVDVHWVERRTDEKFAEVSFATAARNGSPFSALIIERNFLPNPVTRFCTQELKIRVMKAWMLARGYEHWTNVIGLRADEPRRVARIRASEGKDRWDIAVPLADAGVTVADVDAFWKAQPFDLQLRKWEGNCDLCFLKGRAKRTRIMRDRPDLAAWWVQEEEAAIRTPRHVPVREAKIIEHDESPNAPQPSLFGAEFMQRLVPAKAAWPATNHPFRADAPRYHALLEISQQPMLDFDQHDLDGEAIDDIGDCFCNAA